MYAPLSAALRPVKVLFLSKNESAVRSDVRALKGLGVGTFIYAAGQEELLAFLEQEDKEKRSGLKGAKDMVDVVLCEDTLHGAPVSVCLYALAQRPALRVKPLLVLAACPQRAAALRKAGVEVLERPYAEQDLRHALQKAMSPLRRLLSPRSFEEAAKSDGLVLAVTKKQPARPARPGPMTTGDLFNSGMARLKKQEYDGAAKAFEQVLERREDHVGAALGLAKARQGLGDAPGLQRALLRAAAACLRKDDKERATAIAAMLPKGMRDKIFMHEALSRMDEGAYRQAALSFLDARTEQPDTPLHRIIARACLMTAKPEQGMARLCDALDGLGHGLTAKTLRRRLLAYAPYQAQEAPSWLDNYPLLRDVVSVASHTALAWRQL